MLQTSEQFFKWLGVFGTWNPSGWVNAYHHIPLWEGLVLFALGILLLTYGSGTLFRLLAAPWAAVCGIFYIPLVMRALGMAEVPFSFTVLVAAILGFVGFAFPKISLFFSFGLPAGFIVGSMVQSPKFIFFFLGGMVVIGVGAIFIHRLIAVATSALLGGPMVVLGLLALLRHSGSIAHLAQEYDWVVICAAFVLSAAGCIYQLAVDPPKNKSKKKNIAPKNQNSREEFTSNRRARQAL